jgi:hypothetical protein
LKLLLSWLRYGFKMIDVCKLHIIKCRRLSYCDVNRFSCAKFCLGLFLLEMYLQDVQRKRSRDEAAGRSLDPILVAGCVVMSRLVVIVLKFYAIIGKILQGDPDFWEARDDWPMTETKVPPGLSTSITLLAAWRVIQKARPTGARRLFISYFEVPKKDPGLYRAIANCKAMNALFHSVIGFGLATIIEVFRVIAFAGLGFFAVMDLRHWFHQLTLPSEYTRLFSFRFGREIWEWRTWPMGFRYTPVVAQSTVCACLREVGQQLNLMYWSATETIPSPVMVWRDGRGNTLVIAIVWYDNIFLNCSSVGIRKRFLDILARVFRSTNIQLKGDIVLSEGHVEYLGVNYKVRSRNEVEWSHIRPNRERWALDIRSVPSTARDWLQLIGIVNWHVRMKGTPWKEIRGLFRSVFDVLRDHWEHLDEVVVMSTDIQKALQQWTQEACAEGSYTRTLRDIPTRQVFVATDASNWGMGGIVLTVDGSSVITQRQWTPREALWHINTKETIAVIETLTAVSALNSGPCQLIVAVDSVTAIARLRGTALMESELEARLFEMREMCQEDHLRFEYIRSADNPADEPSRGVPIEEHKVRACRAMLLERAKREWFE